MNAPTPDEVVEADYIIAVVREAETDEARALARVKVLRSLRRVRELPRLP